MPSVNLFQESTNAAISDNGTVSAGSYTSINSAAIDGNSTNADGGNVVTTSTATLKFLGDLGGAYPLDRLIIKTRATSTGSATWSGRDIVVQLSTDNNTYITASGVNFDISNQNLTTSNLDESLQCSFPVGTTARYIKCEIPFSISGEESTLGIREVEVYSVGDRITDVIPLTTYDVFDLGSSPAMVDFETETYDSTLLSGNFTTEGSIPCPWGYIMKYNPSNGYTCVFSQDAKLYVYDNSGNLLNSQTLTTAKNTSNITVNNIAPGTAVLTYDSGTNEWICYFNESSGANVGWVKLSANGFAVTQAEATLYTWSGATTCHYLAGEVLNNGNVCLIGLTDGNAIHAVVVNAVGTTIVSQFNETSIGAHPTQHQGFTAYDSTNNKILLTFGQVTTGAGYYVVIDPTGSFGIPTAIPKGSNVVSNTNRTAFDSTNGVFVCAGLAYTGSYYTTYVVTINASGSVISEGGVFSGEGGSVSAITWTGHEIALIKSKTTSYTSYLHFLDANSLTLTHSIEIPGSLAGHPGATVDNDVNTRGLVLASNRLHIVHQTTSSQGIFAYTDNIIVSGNQYLFDGNPSTPSYTVTDSDSTPSLYCKIDLGNIYKINKIFLYGKRTNVSLGHPDFTGTGAIQYSSDDIVYNNATISVTGTVSDSNVVEITISGSPNMRYIKLQSATINFGGAGTYKIGDIGFEADVSGASILDSDEVTPLNFLNIPATQGSPTTAKKVFFKNTSGGNISNVRVKALTGTVSGSKLQIAADSGGSPGTWNDPPTEATIGVGTTANNGTVPFWVRINATNSSTTGAKTYRLRIRVDI